MKALAQIPPESGGGGADEAVGSGEPAFISEFGCLFYNWGGGEGKREWHQPQQLTHDYSRDSNYERTAKVTLKAFLL